MATTYSVTILSKRAEQYRALLTNRLPSNLAVAEVTDNPESLDASEVEVLLADPDLAAKILRGSNKLKWCQSTWAGNTPLLYLGKTDYCLTGVKGVFGAQMREYIFAYILHFSRCVSEFELAQRGIRKDRWNPPAYQRLKGKTLGILGMGSIAKELLPAAQLFGLRVLGVNRSGHPVNGIDHMYTPDNKLEFASQCDYVVNLMPDSPETTDFINYELLSALPSTAVLINAGRGNAVVDSDLINALNNNQLKAAVLDVFHTEPLPDSHPFWNHPNVYITQHTAAESFVEDIAEIFLENAARFIKQQPLRFQFDFAKGY